MENFSDEKLISLYLKGNDLALEIIVGRYLPLIYGLAGRYVGDADKAADVAQEAFIKAWRNLGKFDRKRPLKPWLLAIAKNTALDWLRRREDAPFSFFDNGEDGKNFLENIADIRSSPRATLEEKIANAKIGALTENLPERYLPVFKMRQQDNLSFGEIAAKLREPINTVKSRYRRSLQLLKRKLENLEDTV